VRRSVIRIRRGGACLPVIAGPRALDMPVGSGIPAVPLGPDRCRLDARAN
jgi:hypothetical protein